MVACNTASTLALGELRTRFRVPFVGTVPAIKPACAQSATKRVTVLGTQATVGREYTHALIREFGSGCDVHLVGSTRLAADAEAELAGTPLPDAAIAAEIARCFIEKDGRRTDTIVLACTHYPLLTRALPRQCAVAGNLARSGAGNRTARRRPDARARARRTARRPRKSSLRPGARPRRNSRRHLRAMASSRTGAAALPEIRARSCRARHTE